MSQLLKTIELVGTQLDWAMAKIEHGTPQFFRGVLVEPTNGLGGAYPPKYEPSTNWAQGGPIIGREEISINRDNDPDYIWAAWTSAPIRDESTAFGYGDTPLIAAMRCFVVSELGEEIEVPDELS